VVNVLGVLYIEPCLCVAGCYSVLQCVAVCYSVLQCVAVWCSVVKFIPEWCMYSGYSILNPSCVSQCVAVCCSVLQRAAVCCSVVQCGAIYSSVVYVLSILYTEPCLCVAV